MNSFEIELESLKKFDQKTKSVKGYFYGQKSRYIKNYYKIKRELNKRDLILDIGANPPYFLASLKRIGYNIEGLDINPNFDSELIKEEKLTIKKCDIEKERFPYKDNYFDKIILSEVFEHLYVNPIHCMKEIRRILKKGGKLILTAPNGYSIKRIFNFLMGKGLSENPYREFNLFNQLGYRGHIREYSAKEMINFLENTGFFIIKTEYISYQHMRLRNSPINSLFIKIIYFLFSNFRSHIIIIANKK